MHKSKTNHDYPKNRKPRNTEYSTTYKILQQVGKEKLFEIWKTRGHRATAKYLSEILDIYVSAMVINYIAMRKLKWKRIVTDKNSSIYKSVLNGKVDPSVFKTIIFQ